MSPSSTASSSRPRSLRLHPTPPLPATLPTRRRHRAPRLLRLAAMEGPLPWTRGLLLPWVRPAHLPMPMSWRVTQTYIHLDPAPLTLHPLLCTTSGAWRAAGELLLTSLTPPSFPRDHKLFVSSSRNRLADRFYPTPQLHLSLNM